jgi:signal transduction histidine kinase
MTLELTGLTVTGTVDREGRLIAADPRLLALHRRAGGEDLGPLAIPQLATLARLAQTLGIMVSRTLVAADGDDDLDLQVRAFPTGDIVRLTIGGWSQRLPRYTPRDANDSREIYYAQFDVDGAWESNPRFQLTRVSEALLSLIGLTAQGIENEPLTRLFRLVEGDDGDLPLVTGLAAQSNFAGQIVELRRDAGVRLRLHGKPMFGADGVLSGYAGGFAIIDRPVIPNAEASVILPRIGSAGNVTLKLDDALRPPVARIIATADEISARSSGPIREDYVSYATDIAVAGRHLLGLIDDISDMQSVEQPDFCIPTESVDLVDIAQRAAGLLRVRAADRMVRIDAPPRDDVLTARGDFRRVLQIIVNLLSNAVRYSPAGSSVWVRTELEGDLAAVIVADQGKGIDASDHQRIFEKFERLDQNEPGGSGLGLYISRQLARAMGGDINVDSAPGQGSRFVLTLPSG